MNKFVLTLAACAVVASAGAWAAEDDATKLDAGKTGVEQVDSNRIPQAISDALEDLRRATVDEREAARDAARKLMREIEVAAEAAEDKAEAAGDAAAREWKELKVRLRELSIEADKRIDAMQDAAAEKWNEARDAVAQAIQDAADALKPKG